MRRTVQNLISVFILAFVALLGAGSMTAVTASAAHAFAINDIRVGEHPDKTRMVLDLSSAQKFRVFVLDSPYRLVIDMPSFQWNVGAISKQATSTISAIRQGNLQEGVSRIVVDLNAPIVVDKAFILRAEAGRPDRLVIDFHKAGAGAFAAAKGKIIGILDVDDAAPDTQAAQTGQGRSDEGRPDAVATGAQMAAASGMALPERKPPQTPIAPPAKPHKPVIVIDPGHGGVDPGAIGANGVFEKHVTLAIAKELKNQLERSGRYQVYLTRETDKYLKLYQRVDIARQKNADLFVSLHADSIDKAGVRGASIYTLSEKASDAQTARLAERENKADIIAGADLSHEDQQVADILISLAMRDTMNQSKFMANTMVKSLSNDGIRLLDSAHRYAGFAVLKAPDVPSILVEMGFMSNKNEAQLLTQSDYHRRMSRAIMNGIDAYFEKVHRNNRI